MTDDIVDVAVVGLDRARTRLREAGIVGIADVGGCDLSASSFDEATHAWTLSSGRARIIVTDQIRSGREQLAPYLGVATHGVPNYFMVTGTGDLADAQIDYIAECLEVMQRTGSTRIEVLFSTQRMFVRRGAAEADRADAAYWRRMAELAPSSFDLSAHIGVVDDIYDGAATLHAGGAALQARVRLSGHVDPIDGRYHWQGTVFAELPEAVQSPAGTLTVEDRSAECRITERTQQGWISVAGVGTPPYELDGVEAVVPLR
ncbi:DUF4873 domain-containing protein [Mycobacterium sp. 1274761.0]|uniref:DUF4873 domain-containing protein n=1 Tax=Mycobacterium sp. 1274761.0 TaxID=1834077 RepID=UPI0008017DE6|nr:DUF4873 domain-containing protein [Mycobacterium sp. 1274761.0]OBK74888.1 hypothetical protein A5651_08305 [Mycobacterium sp. 1274761.0]